MNSAVWVSIMEHSRIAKITQLSHHPSLLNIPLQLPWRIRIDLSTYPTTIGSTIWTAMLLKSAVALSLVKTMAATSSRDYQSFSISFQLLRSAERQMFMNQTTILLFLLAAIMEVELSHKRTISHTQRIELKTSHNCCFSRQAAALVAMAPLMKIGVVPRQVGLHNSNNSQLNNSTDAAPIWLARVMSRRRIIIQVGQ